MDEVPRDSNQVPTALSPNSDSTPEVSTAPTQASISQESGTQNIKPAALKDFFRLFGIPELGPAILEALCANWRILKQVRVLLMILAVVLILLTWLITRFVLNNSHRSVIGSISAITNVQVGKIQQQKEDLETLGREKSDLLTQNEGLRTRNSYIQKMADNNFTNDLPQERLDKLFDAVSTLSHYAHLVGPQAVNFSIRINGTELKMFEIPDTSTGTNMLALPVLSIIKSRRIELELVNTGKVTVDKPTLSFIPDGNQTNFVTPGWTLVGHMEMTILTPSSSGPIFECTSKSSVPNSGSFQAEDISLTPQSDIKHFIAIFIVRADRIQLRRVAVVFRCEK